MTPGFWAGKRVLITGHTGFKGGWLSLWLQTLGARVAGYSLAPPTDPSLFNCASVAEGMDVSLLADIRDLDTLREATSGFGPEIVFHLAAQPLVRLSYAQPIVTYATNVMGTVHLLETVRAVPSVKAAVIITTDKCYDNREWVWGYRETDPMGGHDPYSSSKGCAELVTAAYRSSYFSPGGGSEARVASARAGNVIGGGDWAMDRLIPDMIRAFSQGEPVIIRSPRAIRPWQHVLEPLRGYLMLAERLWRGDSAFAEGWNFGPNDEDAMPVQWIVERLAAFWGDGASWRLDENPKPHEATYLKLDCSKVKGLLGWHPRWDLTTALQHIVEWYRAYECREDMRAVTLRQIKAYTGLQE